MAKNKAAAHHNESASQPIQPSAANKQSLIVYGLLILLFIYYYATSKNSTGFYQHDEIGHLMQILDFWKNPMAYLLDMWARGGYKLLYAIPGLAGETGVVITNILFAVGSSWLAYDIAKRYNLRYAWLAVIFTGLQPFIINLSFRCYSEVPTMFMTTLMVSLYIRKKFGWAALVASFLFTMRQEMAVIALILGVIYLFQKRWIPFLLLAWAPLVLNVLGWIHSGDPLFVLHMMTQGGLQDTYQRNGFFYLWLMLPEINGIVVFYFFLISSIAFFTLKNKVQALKVYHAVIVVFAVYFLMHCAFTSKSFGFGRSGGLGRFLLVVLPLLGVIATGAVHYLTSEASKKTKAVVAVVALAVLLLFFAYNEEILPLVFNGYTALADVTQNIQFLVFALAVALLLVWLGKNQQMIVIALAVITGLYAVVRVQPIELNAEDAIMSETGLWTQMNAAQTTNLYSNHNMFNYFFMKEGGDHSKIRGYDSATVVNAKPGDVFIFENHYAVKTINPELFQKGNFKVIREVGYDGVGFRAFVLQK